MKRIVVIIGLFSLVGLLMLPSLASAEPTVLEVIPLKYRTTDEVIPAIRPFLDKQGALSGMQGQLIIRTTPGNLQEIKRLLDNIDTAPRRLKITVKQDVDSTTKQRLRELSGSVGAGDVRVTVPGSGSRDNSGLVIEGVRGNDILKARVVESQSLENDKNTQHLQVLEGNRAFIRVGQSLPVPERSVFLTPQGVRVIESTQFRDATTGFYVLPRINGDRVTLEVSPQRDSPSTQSPGSINIQHIVTSVSGRLGEWIDLGGVGQNKTDQTSAIGSRSTATTSEQRTVLIRVEEVR